MIAGCITLSEVEKANQSQPITFHEIVTAAFFLEAARTKLI
jgi:hypothetical protein